MDISEDFQKYLETWCKTNHKPLPEKGKINKYWQLAWESYMKTELTDKWEQRKNEFLNIKVLTKQEEKRLTKQQALESQYEAEEEDSSWGRVKKFLK